MLNLPPLVRIPHSLRFLLLLVLLLVAPPAVADVPPVVLSAGHQKMCKVGVGDALPDLTITDAKGKEQSLAKLYGKQATVVALVGREHWMNPALLADLPRDVTGPYGERGVSVVVVTVGRRPNVNDVKAGYQLLSDPTGEQFAKLGSGRLPRVYVLDPKGKIVWFDIEYSRSTRRELKQTLDEVVPAPPNSADSPQQVTQCSQRP